MPSSSHRRPLVAGLALSALVAGALVGALPASATQDRLGGPAPKSLRTAIANGGSELEHLPRGVLRRAPKRTSALRSSAAAAPAPRAALTTSKVSTFDVKFVNDGQTWTEPAKAAFLAAASIWERTVESRVPIVVEAKATNLPSGFLGFAGPFDFFRNEGPTLIPAGKEPTPAQVRDDVFEPLALFNARTGRDNLPPDADGLNPDIAAEFDLSTAGLYYGSDGQPGTDQLDFRTIVLHELGHGLGMAGTAQVEGDDAYVGSVDINGDTGVRSGVSYDQFTYATSAAQAGAGGTRILSLPDGATQLKQALESGQLYWAGQQALTAARGSKVRLFAPRQCGEPGPARACEVDETPFQPSSSYSHLDEDSYARTTSNGLMTPFLEDGEAHPDAGQLTMGMLADMGWSVPALGGSRFTAVDPVRVLDTRAGIGAPKAVVKAGGTIDLKVTGTNGVPANASAVVLNVTGVAPSVTTDVRVYPTPVTLTPVPLVSNLNLSRGTARANLVTVPIGNDGKVRLRNNSGTVSLLADLSGYYSPAADSTFTPVDPVRILDTRNAVGTPTKTRVPAGGQVDLTVAGAGGVPAGARAVALTVTAVNASASTDVRVYPAVSDTATVPIVSNINARVGPGVPNVVIVKLGEGGKVRLRNQSGEVHLLADVAGYYDASPQGSLFRAVTPRRLLDTRTRLGTSSSAPTRLGAAQTLTVNVGGVAQIPRLATAAVLNVTGVAASASTDVRVFPATASSTPVVSNLNLSKGQTAADLVVVKLGNGQVKIFNNAGSVALLADAAGWFGPAS